MNKKNLTEADIRTKFATPALVLIDEHLTEQVYFKMLNLNKRFRFDLLRCQRSDSTCCTGRDG